MAADSTTLLGITSCDKLFKWKSYFSYRQSHSACALAFWNYSLCLKSTPIELPNNIAMKYTFQHLSNFCFYSYYMAIIQDHMSTKLKNSILRVFSKCIHPLYSVICECLPWKRREFHLVVCCDVQRLRTIETEMTSSHLAVNLQIKL